MEYFCSSSGGSPCVGISDCNYREGEGGKQSNHRSDLSMKHDDYPQSRDLEDDKREGGRTGKPPLGVIINADDDGGIEKASPPSSSSYSLFVKLRLVSFL